MVSKIPWLIATAVAIQAALVSCEEGGGGLQPSDMENVESSNLNEMLENKLDVAFARRVKQLLQRGEEGKALALLRAMYAFNKHQRYLKCVKALAPAICKQNNPQPFSLWAQVAVRSLNEGGWKGFKNLVTSS